LAMLFNGSALFVWLKIVLITGYALKYA